MGWQEKRLIDKRLKSLKKHERRFRANSGRAWTGEIIKQTDGVLILKNARVFHGMPAGTPDLIGWDSVKITPDMVGQTVAVFVGEEVKATGDLSPGQIKFKNLIEKMGGIFRVLRI